jgi:restriction system protein
MAQESYSPPRPPSPFIGRAADLEWLRGKIPEHPRMGTQDAIAVVGEAGIGKTALVAEHVSRYGELMPCVWINCASWRSEETSFRSIFDQVDIRRRRDSPERLRGLTVVFDGAEATSPRELDEMYYSCLNRKDIGLIIITSRVRPNLRIYTYRELPPLSTQETQELLREQVSINGLAETEVVRLMAVVNGNPDSAAIMAGMVRSLSSDQVRRVLSGNIYNYAESNDDLAPQQVARRIKPMIVFDNDRLIRQLKQKPQDVFGLTDRQFEEVVADLLQDMGYEITLTQQTRDGGKDILAAKKTELGDVLCLVDTKKYKQSRKIGVEMVRTLLGTLTDHNATSAMLATTSTYSKDAYALQDRHKYKLSLKNYADVTGWIQKFRA